MATADVRAETKCAAWFNAALSAFACSPTRLHAAVVNHQLHQKGGFTLRIAGHRTGSAPGLVQVVGGPLKVGTRVAFVGTPSRDEYASVNCSYHSKLYTITLKNIRVQRGATMTVVLRGGRPYGSLVNLRADQTTKPTFRK